MLCPQQVGYVPRGTVLTCGLRNDLVMTLPVYLPVDVKTLQVVVHSIEAQLSPNSSMCGGADQITDPNEPPLYATLVRVEDVVSSAWHLAPSVPLLCVLMAAAATIVGL
jgi:hypothetical protein